MNVQVTRPTHDGAGDDMPAQIDFSKGVRGKFYRPGMRLRLPIYLGDEYPALSHRSRSGQGGRRGRSGQSTAQERY